MEHYIAFYLYVYVVNAILCEIKTFLMIYISADLQPAGEVLVGDKKIVTEYKVNDEGKKVKVYCF